MKFFGILEVEFLSLADALANSFIEPVSAASSDFVETASELEVIGGEPVVAHGDVATFGVHQPGFFIKGEIFSHLVDVGVAVIHERTNLGDLSLGDGPHCREAVAAVVEQEGAVDVRVFYVASSNNELLGSLEGEHRSETTG